MKKVLLYSIIVIAIIVLLSGCDFQINHSPTNTGLLEQTNGAAQLDKYSVYVEAVSDNLHSLNIEENYNFRDIETWNNAEFDSKKTIFFNSREFIGKYQWTKYFVNVFFPIFMYKTEDNVEFGMNPYGTIVYWFDNNAVNQNYNKDPLSKDECEIIATDLFKSVADINNYSLFVNEEDLFYEFEFSKYIGSIKTADRANIIVSKSGSIVCFRAELLNMIDAEAIQKYNPDDIIDAAINKTKDLLDDKNINKAETIEIKNVLLTLTKEGTLAFIVNVNVTLSELRDDYELIDSAVIRLVIFDSTAVAG